MLHQESPYLGWGSGARGAGRDRTGGRKVREATKDQSQESQLGILKIEGNREQGVGVGAPSRSSLVSIPTGTTARCS